MMATVVFPDNAVAMHDATVPLTLPFLVESVVG